MKNIENNLDLAWYFESISINQNLRINFVKSIKIKLISI